MPFLVDVQEAREQAIATLNQKMAEGLDAENAQNNDDCNQLPPEVYPDFETQHPDCFLEGSKQPSKSTSSSYKKITLVDKKEIREQLQKLDPDQRYVIDEQIRYARFLKLARKGYCKFPTPPFMVVEDDAGSGKSKLMKVLCQVMEHEFREGGDDPDQPYILKGAFTGEAVTNIKGQTLQ